MSVLRRLHAARSAREQRLARMNSLQIGTHNLEHPRNSRSISEYSEKPLQNAGTTVAAALAALAAESEKKASFNMALTSGKAAEP
eukprot:1647442-Pleurochrysis_carterae.AAC.1